jgi:adenosylcobinamide-GDP ribazoletransferase
VREGVRSAIAALGFLSVAPVARRAATAEADLRRGLVWFPPIGALIGAVVAFVGWGAASRVPVPVACVLAVAAGALATGFLHLDGLADTADGIGASLSGSDPRDAMADPRIGTFGVVAIGLDLALKAAAVAALLGRPGFPWEVVAAGALGRVAVLGLVLGRRYGGSDEGSGAWTREPDRRRCVAGIGIGLSIAALAVGSSLVVMVAAGAAASIAVGRWSTRHLDGMRGDTFGAALELTESLSLVAVLAVA